MAQTYGFPCSLAIDPIEKKPLYHFLPGSEIFSIATVGCNLFCKWCQNADISHPEKIHKVYGYVSPNRVIELCEESGCKAIAFTYTEPTIFFEYMIDIAKLARQKGIATVMVSNGYITQEPLLELVQYLDAANIDLKAFENKKYLLGTSAELQPVLDSILTLKKAGVHLEITTLIVPEVNDGKEQLEKMYSWVEKHLGKEQVVHISRFFPMHKATDKQATSQESLDLAVKIARKHLHHAYVGNVAAGAETHNTFCPKCNATLINRITKEIRGSCDCGYTVPGIILRQ